MVSATTVAIQCEALKKIFIRGVFVVPPLRGIRSRSRQTSGRGTVRPLNSGEPSYVASHCCLSLGEPDAEENISLPDLLPVQQNQRHD